MQMHGTPVRPTSARGRRASASGHGTSPVAASRSYHGLPRWWRGAGSETVSSLALPRTSDTYDVPITLMMGQLSTVPVILSVTLPALAMALTSLSDPRKTALLGSFHVTSTYCHSVM
jgi:hypothetical protein